MAWEVIEYTEAQLLELKEELPLATPKQFAVREVGLVHYWYDTYEEAIEEKTRLVQETRIKKLVAARFVEMSAEFGLSKDELTEIVKEVLDLDCN